MPDEAVRRQQSDEDTAVGFLGHMKPQADDAPEQIPDDRNRKQGGPEQSPSQSNKHDRRKDKKHNRGNRK
jgi:hypothetical protein